MRTFNFFLAVALFSLAFSRPALAQEDATTAYHMLSYMKVAPGMHDEYIQLEKAWKKIHQANIKAGNMASWALITVVFPAGENVEYNYVTRNTFAGEDQFARFFENNIMPDNWQSLLTPDEIELVNRTEDIRTMVKMEVWSEIDWAAGTNALEAKVNVFNYFDLPEGKTRGDHIKIEREIWKPVHEAAIKDGKLKGWLLLGLEMPFGSAMPYQLATVDFYADMKAYLMMNPMPYFGKVHPGKDLNKLMQETQENSNLVRGEIRMLIDSAN